MSPSVFPFLMPIQDEHREIGFETALKLAVIMERKVLANKWASEQWEAHGVVPDHAEDGAAARCIREAADASQWLFPGYTLRLFADEAENYLLNVTAPEPRVFVMWQMEEQGGVQRPRPMVLTVSYGEAAAMMDANEQVDGVPLPADISRWVTAFARRHYRAPEKRKGGRFASQRMPLGGS
jgi:hypothetical protein